MASPLLETKLHVPVSRRALVALPRPIERLDRGAAATLTLVSAPAGFGKTTLLVDWLAAAYLNEVMGLSRWTLSAAARSRAARPGEAGRDLLRRPVRPVARSPRPIRRRAWPRPGRLRPATARRLPAGSAPAPSAS
jgi:hypothetical protein